MVVGTPPPAPPELNVINAPLVYPVPPELIVTESKNPIPLLPPSITQSKYATLATLLSPMISVYIVIGSSFSNVPILKSAPVPVPTPTTLAYVFDTSPLINAAALLWNVAVPPFEYLVVLKPMLVALDPITVAVTDTLAVESIDAFTDALVLKYTSDAPVLDTVFNTAIAFVLLPLIFRSSLNAPTTSFNTISELLAVDTIALAPELVILTSVTLAVVPGAPFTKILSSVVNTPNTPLTVITVELVIAATIPFAPELSLLIVSLTENIACRFPDVFIVNVTNDSSSTGSLT